MLSSSTFLSEHLVKLNMKHWMSKVMMLAFHWKESDDDDDVDSDDDDEDSDDDNDGDNDDDDD